MELKGSKTWDNLHAAWAGETQAAAKYLYYAGKARKDGYEDIAEIFEETAKNERAHGKIWFKHIMNGIPDTEQNLTNARDGEHYEWSEMYAEFAKVAKEEGFPDIARQFELVAEIEHAHMKRYDSKRQEVSDQTVFRRQNETRWICTNCGHIHTGKEAPAVCPVCSYPRSYFREKTES